MNRTAKIMACVLLAMSVGLSIYIITETQPRVTDSKTEIVTSAKEKLKEICNRFGTLAIDFPEERIDFLDPDPNKFGENDGAYYPALDSITIKNFSKDYLANQKLRNCTPQLEQTLTLTHELIHAQCSNFSKECYSAFWLEGMASLISSAGFSPGQLKECRMEFGDLWGLGYGEKIVYIYRVAELISQKTNTKRDRVVDQLIKLFLQNDTHTFDEYIDSALGQDTCKTYFKNIAYKDPCDSATTRQETQTIAKLYAKNKITQVHIEFPTSLFATPAPSKVPLLIDNYKPEIDL